ncbi:hypothetical protein CFOL_v3_19075 [Cephalotus follicularis]|uniref:Uncharacterized protein n=1 Tax=Cephalotus follicularis TaxID=3775 RepID=A0A1Q3C5S3_CEPFO|nr:hypothetical protein CFOL_v3_19075 [Cephalotus follicularis]
MGGAATLSLTCINPSSSYNTDVTSLSFHCHFHSKTPIRVIFHGHVCQPICHFTCKTTTTTCLLMGHAISKLNNSVGEEDDGIGEGFVDGNDMIEDESEEDDTESSVDLLIRFLLSMFKKVSRRAKKASLSILPAAISPQLVKSLTVDVYFAVDGVLLLALLSIVKSLLEVVCTLGGTVFVVILLLRVIWAAISYFQLSGKSFNEGGSSFGTAQAVI